MDQRLEELPSAGARETLGREFLQRLQSRLELALERQPVDLDFLEFICASDLTVMSSMEGHIPFPPEVFQGLQEMLTRIVSEKEMESNAVIVNVSFGNLGRPKIDISREHLERLIEMDLSVACISTLLGISTKTIHRRMSEWDLSITSTYSDLTEEELDGLVLSIKSNLPNLGCKLVKGHLKALGHRLQWSRVWESMHRVDAAGILDRFASLGCVARRAYSVPGPLSLVHLDTNHKLIRYGLVIFGAIDGFSRKIMYLKIHNNNKASTALKCFIESAEENGFPLRVRGDQGVENVDVARLMFEVRGCGRGSFISGKSVHNQRIERLWRDVWAAVSSLYYEVLHSLEEEGALDPANPTHLFCLQYVFLPRIQADLATFIMSWNNHPLRTERNYSPNQLWEIGLIQRPVDPPNLIEGQEIPHMEMDETGLTVPELDCPLNREEMDRLSEIFIPTSQSVCFGADIFTAVVQHVENAIESRG